MTVWNPKAKKEILEMLARWDLGDTKALQVQLARKGFKIQQVQKVLEEIKGQLDLVEWQERQALKAIQGVRV